MVNRSFRQALLERHVTIGTWLQINNATSAEVLANAGFDWIAIDTERWVVILHPNLRGGHYSPLHGSKVRRPQDPRFHPSLEALDTARRQAGL